MQSFTEVKWPKPEADFNITNAFCWKSTPAYKFIGCGENILVQRGYYIEEEAEIVVKRKVMCLVMQLFLPLM